MVAYCENRKVVNDLEVYLKRCETTKLDSDRRAKPDRH